MGRAMSFSSITRIIKRLCLVPWQIYLDREDLKSCLWMQKLLSIIKCTGMTRRPATCILVEITVFSNLLSLSYTDRAQNRT